MIVVYSCAGLANRMFHYAVYKSLTCKGFDVYFDDNSYISQWEHENVSLKKVFPNVNYRVSTKYKRAAKRTLFDKIYTHLSSILGGNYYYYYGFQYNPKIFQNKLQNKCLIGNWQSEKYFKDIEHEIRKDFTFKPFTDSKNQSLAQEMKEQNSIAIHIRKNIDYTSNNLYKGTCPIEYYLKAIEYIKNKIEKPKFYVFTDNKEWVKQNLTNLDYTLCDWNPTSGEFNYLDMQLMSCAKHNIIANSTYSWWAAWLNINPEKIIIAPSLWFNPISKLYSNVDIVPDTWIKL